MLIGLHLSSLAGESWDSWLSFMSCLLPFSGKPVFVLVVAV